MDYYQGYEDATRQSRVRRGIGLTGFVTRMIFSLLYSAFIYIPLLVLSYWLATTISDSYSNDLFIKSGLTILICYLLFALIYFLKGLLIGLRNSGRNSWFVLWMLCVVLTCGAQAVLAQAQLENIFSSRSIANYELWSWLGAALVGLIIYSHYQFLTNVAPRSVFWSYQFGFRAFQSLSNIAQKDEPRKSTRYFENAPMNVSYRK
jgi:hypothetical protein